MSKETYLSLLRTYLTGRLPASDVEDILRYYTEYFADAGVGREQSVMMELGSPEALAHQILSERSQEEPGMEPEYDYNADYIPVASGKLPPWAFFLIAGGALFFGWPVLLGLFLGLGLAGGLCVLIGLGVAGSAFTKLSFAGALYEAGGGLMATGVGVILLFALVTLVRLGVRGIRYLWETMVEHEEDYYETNG